MGSVSRNFVAAQFAILGALGVAPTASACECRDTLGMKEARLVFVGKAISRTEWAPPPGDAMLLRANRFTFAVEESIKGPKLDKAVVDTYTHMCGYRFEIGHRYIVYAESLPERKIQWFTSICASTAKAK